MTVKYIIIENIESIEKSRDLGINEPEPVYKRKRLMFDINSIIFARVTEKNMIELKIGNDDYFHIFYDENVLKQIEENINAR